MYYFTFNRLLFYDLTKERKIMLRSTDFDRFDVILDELRDVFQLFVVNWT